MTIRFLGKKKSAQPAGAWHCEVPGCENQIRGRMRDGKWSEFCEADEAKFRKCITDFKHKGSPLWFLKSKKTIDEVPGRTDPSGRAPRGTGDQ